MRKRGGSCHGWLVKEWEKFERRKSWTERRAMSVMVGQMVYVLIVDLSCQWRCVWRSHTACERANFF